MECMLYVYNYIHTVNHGSVIHARKVSWYIILSAFGRCFPNLYQHQEQSMYYITDIYKREVIMK